MTDGYAQIGGAAGPTYVRKESVGRLRGVTSVIFDCDGVLIDILASYGKAVASVTSELVGSMTGARVDPGDMDDEVNYAYKSLGGFNNDWDLTYAFTTVLLDSLPEAEKAALERLSARARDYSRPGQLLRFYEEHGEKASIGDVRGGLLRAVGRLDQSGIASVDRLLDGRLSETRRALAYPGAVGEGLIPTLFEERFSGPELFRETWGVEPQFEPKGPAYVENEKPTASPDTVDAFVGMFGWEGLGIASGSAENTAKRVIGKQISGIGREAQVWMEDVMRDTAEAGRSLAKPNPHSLLRVAEALPEGIILYVGDTAADQIMAGRADAEAGRFVFAGVYGSTYSEGDAKRAFFASGADIVVPTVNELPRALRYARGESN